MLMCNVERQAPLMPKCTRGSVVSDMDSDAHVRARLHDVHVRARMELPSPWLRDGGVRLGTP